jgi:hypothetical protein
MKKYHDVESAGKSKLVPHKKGESRYSRHQRRLVSACKSKEEVEKWCEECGLSLTVTNGGHHWRFTRVDLQVFVEWWPSSAKMVIDKKYDCGIHCHDYTQVIKIMEDRLGIRKLPMLKIKFNEDVFLGPSKIFKITGNFMRQGGDSRIVARYSKHFWNVGAAIGRRKDTCFCNPFTGGWEQTSD